MTNYVLPTLPKIWGHGLWYNNVVTDIEEPIKYADIQVASGDYFVTLATKLDKLYNQFDDFHKALVGDEMEEIVNDLLYIQNKYRIIHRNY